MTRALARPAAGATAGLLAGVLMALVSMILSGIAGLGFLFPLHLVSGVFLGVNSILGGVAALLLGSAIHLLVSAGLGIQFSKLVEESDSVLRAGFMGLIFGTAIWATMTFAVLPIFNPTLTERVTLTPTSWFLQNLIYGGALATTPALIRRFSRKARPADSSAPPVETPRAA